MITWIVLGSSPAARDAYAHARRLGDGASVITCNRGLEIEPDPDFFFLSDTTACRLWSAAGKAAAKRGKTKTVTLRRCAQEMKMRTVDDFDLVVRAGHPFEPFQLSGLWCAEFAIRFGRAERVLLCGLDGYTQAPGRMDYFPGAYEVAGREDLGSDLTPTVVAPATARLVEKYPGVSFLCLGHPCYQIELPNWAVCTP